MKDLSLEKVSEELQNILIIFAEFYKYPSEELIKEINTGQLDRDLAALFSNVGFLFKPNIQENIQTGLGLREQYHYCFSGIKKPFVTPVESIYKQWTSDQTVKLSIAKSKGYLMGDSALHMKHLFQQFGVTIPDEYAYMPDHLTLQLEFLALLIEKKRIDIIKQFFKDHLDWLPFMIDELKPLDDSSFYIYITVMLQSFLDHLNQLISRELEERSESTYV